MERLVPMERRQGTEAVPRLEQLQVWARARAQPLLDRMNRTS